VGTRCVFCLTLPRPVILPRERGCAASIRCPGGPRNRRARHTRAFLTTPRLGGARRTPDAGRGRQAAWRRGRLPCRGTGHSGSSRPYGTGMVVIPRDRSHSPILSENLPRGCLTCRLRGMGRPRDASAGLENNRNATPAAVQCGAQDGVETSVVRRDIPPSPSTSNSAHSELRRDEGSGTREVSMLLSGGMAPPDCPIARSVSVRNWHVRCYWTLGQFGVNPIWGHLERGERLETGAANAETCQECRPSQGQVCATLRTSKSIEDLAFWRHGDQVFFRHCRS
jgi:hypothetical protein